MENKQTLKQTIDENSNVARFAKCLGISRPSMYKYIESYDNGDMSSIPENVLPVFRTLMSGNREFKLMYCNELYAKYLSENEQSADAVPKEIAEKIDSQGITLEMVDIWIKDQEMLKRYLMEDMDDPQTRKFHEKQLVIVEQHLRDLEYTREMVEKRQNEKHFVTPAKSEEEMEWYAFIGKSLGYMVHYDLVELKKHPEILDAFKIGMKKNKDGSYLFCFAGASEGDEITVNVLAHDNCDESGQDFYFRIASYSPEKNQSFVVIPEIFGNGSGFRFELERRNNGVLLNHNNMDLGPFVDYDEYRSFFLGL